METNNHYVEVKTTSNFGYDLSFFLQILNLIIYFLED